MSAIAIVDDRATLRRTVLRQMESHVGHGLKLIETPPLADVDEYASWVIEKDVVGLVVDERLGEQSRVTYSGHDVAASLRSSNIDLPILILTAYPPDSQLQGTASMVEDVVQRRDFNNGPEVYVDRIVRAGKRYSRERTKALVELSNLAKKIALGRASRSERARAEALQTDLHINIGLGSVATRADWVGEMNTKLNEISELRKKLEARLKRRTR